MSIYTISTQTFYDSYSQNYKNIYVIDRKPSGELSKIVRQVTAPKLSPFISNENSCCNNKCIYAIFNPENTNEFLCIEQLGMLFDFLMSKGYTIDSNLTTMMQSSKVTFKKNFVCFVRKID
jgi:hypothetical protein